MSKLLSEFSLTFILCVYGQRRLWAATMLVKTCFSCWGNSNSINQLAYMCSLISNFVIRFLEIINSLPASSKFYRLLMIFANSFDPDQARQNVGTDLGPNRLTLRRYSYENMKNVRLKNICRWQNIITQHAESCGRCVKYLLQLWLALNSLLLVSSANKICKLFGLRSGLTKCWAWSGSKLFDTLIVLLKEFFENVDFEIKAADDKKACKISQ